MAAAHDMDRPAPPGVASEGTPIRLRLRVYASRSTLDRRIAHGGPCDATPALVLRAAQLTDLRTRRRIATSLRRIVDHADRRGAEALFSPVVVDRRAVSAAREPLLGLAERLEDSTVDLDPIGIALAHTLLTDGLGPLYNNQSPRPLPSTIWEIADALTPPGSGSRDEGG